MTQEIKGCCASQKQKLIEEIEGMKEQNEITQAILGALEYRGFNDAGKYLDGSIWERIKPIIISNLRK